MNKSVKVQWHNILRKTYVALNLNTCLEHETLIKGAVGRSPPDLIVVKNDYKNVKLV